VLDDMQREGLVQRVVEVIIDEGREVRVRLAGGTRQRLVGVVVPVEEALQRLHQHIHLGCCSIDGAPVEL
jgi:signal transduction histidine kinase